MLRPTKVRRVVLAVGALSLAGALAVGCGGADQSGTSASPTPTLTVTATTSASPTTSKPSPEPGLTRSKVVLVREFADGQRALVAYDFSTGRSRRLVDLSRDEDPTVSPDGTQVVLVRANGPWRDPVTNRWLAKSGSRLVLIDLVDGDERMLTSAAHRTKRYSPQWNHEDGWVYYREQAGKNPMWLMRVNPETGQVERVQHGRGITGFTLQPDQRYAWVRATWCADPRAGCACEAWRLDLTTGQVTLHRAHLCEADSLVWSASGHRLAYAVTGDEGTQLYVAPWPGSWRRPPQQARPPASRLLYEGPGRPGSSGTFFGGLGWTPGDRAVVLASRHATWGPNWSSPAFDRWYVSLIDRRTGERTDITPRGAADTSFDVWWPAG